MTRSQTQSLLATITLIGATSFALNSCARRDQPAETANSSASPTPAVVSMAIQSPTPIDALPATATPSPAIKMGTANDAVDQRIGSNESASPQAEKSPPRGSDPGIGNGMGIGPGEGGGPLDNPKVWRDPSKIDYNRIYSGKEVDRRAHILVKPEPAYTDAARQHDITGTVVLRAVLTAEGTVTDIKALNSLPDGLTERAIEAARRIKFEPAQINGRAVSMYIQLQYNFNLY